MLDIPDHIITGTSRRRVIRQVNGHRIRNVGVVENICPGIAVIHVITNTREDRIVACSRIDRH